MRAGWKNLLQNPVAKALHMNCILMLVSANAMLAYENAAEDLSVETIVIEKPGVIVEITGIDEAYGEAFALILSEARMQYEEAFGLAMPETVMLEAKREYHGRGRPVLYTNGKSSIFLIIESEQHLATPSNNGPHNIYGMCHELGHIAMYGKMSNTIGLPIAVAEGWAHYAGSVIEDSVARVLGENIWPEPFDVLGTECIARLKRQIEGKDLKDLKPTLAGAKMFYELERKHGRRTVGLALAHALSRSPSGEELMPVFLHSLRLITRDSTAGDWIPEEFVNPNLAWRVKERLVDTSFFDDMKILTDSTGLVLYYDDGTNEGKLSMPEMGHVILFQRPEGRWFLDKVYVYGVRYGEHEAPARDFSVYVCDENFHAIREIKRAYSLIDDAKEKWHIVEIGSISIPQRFYICLYFDPANKTGVRVSFDNSVDHPHSFIGLPDVCVTDVEGRFDWMIRVHFRRPVEK